MAHYRFYWLVGNRILHGEDVDLPDDAAAEREADARLAAEHNGCDSIEVWQGTRRIGLARSRPSQ